MYLYYIASISVFQFLMQKSYILTIKKNAEIVKVVVEMSSPIVLLHRFVLQ